MTVAAANEEEARTTVERMCDQLLANPVIETYEVTVSPVAIGLEGR